MIVARGGFTIGRSGDSVRRRTLLETVRGPRYSANMCSVNISSATNIDILVGHKNADGPTPPKRLTEEERWTSSRT